MISQKKDITNQLQKERKKQEKFQGESAKKNDFYHLVQISLSLINT
jgi:hypothetical protein